MSRRETRILLIGISYTGFVILGMPSGLLGVAWPSVRETFGVSLDAVGALLIVGTIGYLLSSFTSGPIISRIGIGTLLTISSAIAGVGLLGYTLAPSWWILVALGLLAGIGGGAIDAGLNTYFATNHSASLMNWLHASFGLGATVGPIVMTAVLNAGQSWRWGYVIVGILQMGLAVCFGITLSRWRLTGPGDGSDPQSTETDTNLPANRPTSGDTLRLPAAWLGIVLFFMFTGVEITAGQWPYTLFTEARSVAPATAGFWVSVYWGSLTVGRILLGVFVDRLGVIAVSRACMLGTVLGSACIWWNTADIVSFLGLALIGFSVAPLFPSQISITPQRVGTGHAANAIGFQVAAASLGIASLPGLAGVLAENAGLETIGPFLLVISTATLLLHEALVHRSAARQPKR
jgi:fucose permease